MNSLRTPFNRNPAHPLVPSDKLIMKESAESIIADLKKLLDQMNSTSYVKAIDKVHLSVAIRLAQNLGYSDCSKADCLVRELRKGGGNYLKVDDRKEIKLYLEYLIERLSKLGEPKNLKTTEEILSIESLLEKLNLPDFDNLFDPKNGGISMPTWNILDQAGAWKARPNYLQGKILV